MNRLISRLKMHFLNMFLKFRKLLGEKLCWELGFLNRWRLKLGVKSFGKSVKELF